MSALNVGSIGEELNLLIKQGSTFGPLVFTISNPDATPLNFTGCSVSAQIRKVPTKPAVTAVFNCVITQPLTGRFEVSLSSAQTAVIKASDNPESKDNIYYWDLELTDSSGRVIPLYWGTVTIFREVTRV